VGYALLTTVVARRSQLHRAQLAAHVTLTNPALAAAQAQLATALARGGVPPAAAPEAATGVLNAMVDQQAGIMAYNDAAWLVGLILLASLALLLLFPGRQTHARNA
jgi:MFS transporter, DHA2 family, multidrug resistance protein